MCRISSYAFDTEIRLLQLIRSEEETESLGRSSEGMIVLRFTRALRILYSISITLTYHVGYDALICRDGDRQYPILNLKLGEVNLLIQSVVI